MKILKTDSYISEKLGIKPVSKTRLIDIKESFVIATDRNIEDILSKAIEKYGNNADLNFILTHKVTDMHSLFTYESEFNGDISKWDVGNVTNMSGMFEQSEFNGDISKWDVSNVTSMDAMFCQSKFNGDISKWNVSNVLDMEHMFFMSEFNGNISEWSINKYAIMNEMFHKSPLENNPPAWYK